MAGPCAERGLRHPCPQNEGLSYGVLAELPAAFEAQTINYFSVSFLQSQEFQPARENTVFEIDVLCILQVKMEPVTNGSVYIKNENARKRPPTLLK